MSSGYRDSHDAGPFLGQGQTPEDSTDSVSPFTQPRNLAAWLDQTPRATMAAFDSPMRQGTPLMPATPIMPHHPYADDAPSIQSQQGLGGFAGASGTRDTTYHTPFVARRSSRKRWCFIGAAVVVVVIIAVVLGVVFGVVRKQQGSSSSSGSSSTPTVGGSGTVDDGHSFVIGKDGTTVTAEDGSTFVYNNTFGGWFVDDPNDPFNNGAKAQSFSPGLNESWTWGVDKVRGVNLGGWLVLEPFITPALYQKYMPTNPSVNGDEWSLSIAMANDTAGGGINQIEDHYKTFITEYDFAQMAGAGLNFIRLPLPWWALGPTWGDEPFLAQVSWQYALKAFKWARKYGLRVNLDLHTMPGSQNGWNHSGRLGFVSWMTFPMGYANAQRSLDYIRQLTEFITQPEYQSLIPIWGIVNEPTVDLDTLAPFYLEAYNMIRSITGIGEGKGPYISIHDHFFVVSTWAGFFSGADRLMLDTHPYFAFSGTSNPNIAPFVPLPCNTWGQGINISQTAFGVTVAGEWSLGFNDCGLFLQGLTSVPLTTNCDFWEDYANYDDGTKQSLYQFALTSMDALQHWFFWTWKIQPSLTSGKIETPLWSYQLGLEQGWMPKDPREAVGACASAGVTPQPTAIFNGTYSAWQTGGAGAGTIAADQLSSYGLWPPTSMPGIAPTAPLPSYTPTAPIVTLTGPTGGPTPVDGWFDQADQTPFVTTIAGCAPTYYLDPWNPGAALPTCGSASPTVTPPP